MSATKRRLEELESRGFGDTGLFVCAQCLDEDALAVVLEETLEEEDCSYCGIRPSAPLDDVLAFMLNALRLEYRPWSEENPGWDDEDRVYTAREFRLPDLVLDNLSGEWDPKLGEDITRALADADP